MKKLTQDNVEIIKQRHSNGVSMAEIAKEVNVTPCTISHLLQRLGIREIVVNNRKLDRCLLLVIYSQTDWSTRQIGEFLKDEFNANRSCMQVNYRVLGLKHRIRCVNCGCLSHTRNYMHCDGCRQKIEQVRAQNYYEAKNSITSIRSNFAKICSSNLEEANRIKQQMLKEEGEQFTNLALDGILDNQYEPTYRTALTFRIWLDRLEKDIYEQHQNYIASSGYDITVPQSKTNLIKTPIKYLPLLMKSKHNTIKKRLYRKTSSSIALTIPACWVKQLQLNTSSEVIMQLKNNKIVLNFKKVSHGE